MGIDSSRWKDVMFVICGKQSLIAHKYTCCLVSMSMCKPLPVSVGTAYYLLLINRIQQR